MRIALTRDVSPGMNRCELSHLARSPIDVARAVEQHAAYEQALMELGCTVHRLPADDTMPDAVFIEDTAVVVPELAVMARPGAASRRAEPRAVAHFLAPHRPIATIEAPGTLDGGDVLRIGRTLYVGVSARSNHDGIAQLARHLAPWDYRVVPVATHGCLHLKTAATEAAPGILVVNPAWVDAEVFGEAVAVPVDPGEPFAANVLRVGEATICAAAHPRTQRRLEDAGIAMRPVEASEFAKAEGGVTCCSIILDSTGGPG
jgi:dimethylargininase